MRALISNLAIPAYLLFTILAGLLWFYMGRDVKKRAEESKRGLKSLFRSMIRDAIRCGATRIRLGLPDNNKPRIPYAAARHLSEAARDELAERDGCIRAALLRTIRFTNPNYDVHGADFADIAEEFERLTGPPIVTSVGTKMLPIWFECEDSWREQEPMPLCIYGVFIESITSSFAAIPGRKDSIAAEYIETDWDEKQKVYVQARICIEPDYHLSVDILGWTDGN